MGHRDAEALRILKGGKTLGELAKNLLNAFDPDFVAVEVQRKKFGDDPPTEILPEPTQSELSALRVSVATRLDQQLGHGDAEALRRLTGGRTLGELAKDLLNAFDPDFIAAEVPRKKFGDPPPAGILPEPSSDELSALRASVANHACASFENDVLRAALGVLRHFRPKR